MDTVIIQLLLSNFQILFEIVTPSNPKSIPLNIKQIVITNSQPNKLQLKKFQWNNLQLNNLKLKNLQSNKFQSNNLQMEQITIEQFTIEQIANHQTVDVHFISTASMFAT